MRGGRQHRHGAEDEPVQCVGVEAGVADGSGGVAVGWQPPPTRTHADLIRGDSLYAELASASRSRATAAAPTWYWYATIVPTSIAPEATPLPLPTISRP